MGTSAVAVPRAAASISALTAGDLAALVAAGDLSAREVVEAHLVAIEAANPQANAVTRLLADEALEQAAVADRLWGVRGELGPLHGVPFTVKESIDVAGCPTTAGVAALAGATASEDAAAVARLRSAGAIPIARTNCPDFALRLHTHSSLAGQTSNPTAPDRTPGGSSGGEAAALAAHLTPMGLGTDLGGSVRYPAQCCGVAGFKPSAGRVPWTDATAPRDHIPAVQAMATIGPMARCVDDLRRILMVIAGPDPRDPWALPVEDRPSAGRRAGLLGSVGGRVCDPRIAAAVAAAGRALESAGYDVDEIDLPEGPRVVDVWATIVLTELHARWPLLRRIAGPEAVRFLELCFQRWRPADVGGLVDAYVERRRLARRWADVQQRYPVIVGPVSDRPAFPVGRDLESVEAVDDIFASLALTIAGNLFGVPAAAVPTGSTGAVEVVQVLGRRFEDAGCLAAAAYIEHTWRGI